MTDGIDIDACHFAKWLPEPGSVWRHSSGRLYTVLLIANLNPGQPDKYPVTVVYAGENGKQWAGRADDWHRRMTIVADRRPRAARVDGSGGGSVMASQPFHHSASILFTTKDTSVSREEMTKLLRLAFYSMPSQLRSGIVVDTMECEEISDEAGDPNDL